MGQGASQPSDQEGLHNEDPDHFKMNEKTAHRKSLKASKKGKSHAKSPDESATKRKRKSGDHDKKSVAPVPTTPSPLDEQSSRPVKRKKTRDEDNTEIETPKSDSRKMDKAARKMKEQSTTAEEMHHHVSPNRVRKSEAAPSPKIEETAPPVSEQDSEDEQKEAIPMSGSPAPEGIHRQRTRRREGNRYSEKGHLVGHFHPEEIQQIERFKIEFCNTHGITSSDFDDMVQHAVREKEIPFPGAEILPKQEFWQSIYEVLPNRDRRSVYRFMRRHFQSSEQKPHVWTHEQDDELIELFEEHGPKFAYIASLLGRNDDDVVQRWKNRLQHRRTMNRGPWTDDETTELRDAIQEIWNRLKETGNNVGTDIYEMDEKMVAWGSISDRLQNRRSRQQCGDKWRKLRRKILLGRAQRGKGASAAAKEIQQNDRDSKNHLSSPYVNSSDDDEDDNLDESLDEDKGKPGRSDSDGGRSPAQEEEKKAPASSSVSKSVPKPGSDADSGSESGESSSDSESESDNSSSDSDSDEEEDEEEESHTSMEPNALQSTPHTQLGEQKKQEGIMPSVKSKSEMASGDSQGSIKQEKPAEKANDAKATPNMDNLQDRESSSGSSSEGEDEDSEDDKSQSSAHSHSSSETKSQNVKIQPQPSGEKIDTGAKADKKSDSASSDESETGSESESESEEESDMDLDLPPKREPEKPTKPPPKEEANPKPRLSLLQQLKQEIKPAKPSPFIKAPAPAKDSSSSSDETESSSESSSDNSSEDSSSEDDQPAKPAQASDKEKSQNPPAKIPPLIGRSTSVSAPKPAPSDSESDDESDSSSSSPSSDDESDSEKESKPTGSLKQEPKGQGHTVKRRSPSAPESDRSVDQGSKRKRSSTSTSASYATRDIKAEAANSSESDAKPPGKKTKVQNSPSSARRKLTGVKKEHRSGDSDGGSTSP